MTDTPRLNAGFSFCGVVRRIAREFSVQKDDTHERTNADGDAH